MMSMIATMQPASNSHFIRLLDCFFASAVSELEDLLIAHTYR
jgi:hypothetical protein